VNRRVEIILEKLKNIEKARNEKTDEKERITKQTKNQVLGNDKKQRENTIQSILKQNAGESATCAS